MKIWLFVYGIGKVTREYCSLSGQAEKIEFLIRKSGKQYTEVIWKLGVL